MSDRFRRIEAAFHAARETADPAERERILVAACAGDQAMLAELRRMLASNVPTGFLEPEPDASAPKALQRLGEFELEREVASSSNSVVWIARQPSLDRTVAVKILTTGPGTPPSKIDRFHREAWAVSRLNHPHIVPIYAVGTTASSHWFAMQYVDGHSLATEIELQRERRPGAPPPLLPQFGTGAWFAAVARLCADAADALQLAHAAQIVHRDIKPHNLLLDRQGNVLVADFGIARDERFGSMTDPAAIIGTWHYMSPEQAHIENAPVDHRTDVYSLGVVLYELLTLQRPFEGSTSQEIFDKIRRAPARPVCRLNRHVPRDLETICMAAMAREPADRYARAEQLRDDLLRFLDHQAIERQPPSWPVRARQWLNRRRRPIAVAAAVAVVTTAAVLLQSSLEAAARRSVLVGRSEGMLSRGDLDAAPIGELAALLRDIRAAGDEPSLRQAEGRLLAYRDDLLRRCREGLQTAPTLDDLTGRLTALLDAFKTAWRARALDPSAVPPQAVDDNPTHAAVAITVTDYDGHSVPATIGLRFVEPTTAMPGGEQLLGAAPIASRPLPQGMYRIVVHSDQYGEREFTRVFTMAQHAAVTLQLRAVESPTAGMVQIPAGPLQLEPENDGAIGLGGRVVEVPAFWLDRCEVTVGEYRRFLQDSRRAPPTNFDRIPAGNERKPVTYVTWEDARAYAEWAGKRLPSFAEWMLAARGPGPNPRLLPWTADGYFGNCRAPADFRSGADGYFQAWVRHTTDVDAAPDSGSPEGVLELFGNVEEWTESLGATRDTGRLIVQIDHRMVVGSPWFALTLPGPDNLPPNLTSTTNADEGRMYCTFYRGFRCARSTTR